MSSDIGDRMEWARQQRIRAHQVRGASDVRLGLQATLEEITRSNGFVSTIVDFARDSSGQIDMAAPAPRGVPSVWGARTIAAVQSDGFWGAEDKPTMVRIECTACPWPDTRVGLAIHLLEAHDVRGDYGVAASTTIASSMPFALSDRLGEYFTGLIANLARDQQPAEREHMDEHMDGHMEAAPGM